MLASYVKGEMRDTVLLFQDETELNLNPTLTRCWAKRGKRVKVLTPRRNQKKYLFGAIEPLGREVFWAWSLRKDSVSFCRFVERIMEALPERRVVLVLDNFSAHKSASTVAKLSSHEAAGRLRCFFLPSYAPELNPMEKVWQLMRRRVTHNYCFLNLGEAEHAVDSFLQELEKEPEMISSLAGLKEERRIVYVA